MILNDRRKGAQLLSYYCLSTCPVRPEKNHTTKEKHIRNPHFRSIFEFGPIPYTATVLTVIVYATYIQRQGSH